MINDSFTFRTAILHSSFFIAKIPPRKRVVKSFGIFFMQNTIRLVVFIGTPRRFAKNVKTMCGNRFRCKVAGCRLRFGEPWLQVLRTQPATRNRLRVSSCVYVRMYTYLIYIKLK